MAEYIERETLWRAFEYEPFYDNADRDEIVLPKIDDFPAADVAPVVHGRWRFVRDNELLIAECDQCYMVQSGPLAALWNYCPNCGARMDGG